MTKRNQNWVLALVIIALITAPLIIFNQSEFAGTDDLAVMAIEKIDAQYRPFFGGIKLFESEEITSTLFALQAAIGASILGYYIGYARGKRTKENQ